MTLLLDYNQDRDLMFNTEEEESVNDSTGGLTENSLVFDETKEAEIFIESLSINR